MRIFKLSAIAVVFLATSSAHANMLVNGDFSLGDYGFSSQYQSNTDLYAAGVYVVGSNPHIYHSAAINFGDHTSGDGLMFMSNGSMTGDQTLWQEAVSVSENTTYIFSGYVTTWGRGGSDLDPSPPALDFYINGKKQGDRLIVPAPNNNWTQFSFEWNSKSDSGAVLRVVDANLDAYGNDLSMDDLSFSATSVATVPEPETYALMLAGLAVVGAAARRRKSVS